MKRCLGSARLLYLDHGSSLRQPLPVLHRCRRSQGSPLHRPQWRRQFSAGAEPPIDSQILEDYIKLKHKNCPVQRSEEKNPGTWIYLLNQHLPESMRGRRSPEEKITDPTRGTPAGMTQKMFVQTLDLVNLLFYARSSVNMDLLAHLGLKQNNWAGVYLLVSRLLDAADALQEVSLPHQYGLIGDLGPSSSLTLDQLTDHCLSSAPRIDARYSKIPQIPGFTTLDALTSRPFAKDHTNSFMAEVWQSLGSIVLDAADAPPAESKLAMSYVFRILARLHHSGGISDRVYRYVNPDSFQPTFRPPGMHLLVTHIMDVLSDTAWLAHEAEVAARAAAAGEDPPFLPVKMGIRELGPEIWLEFILWCCVEHGHIKEGVWIIDRLRSKTGNLAWKFQSWRPLLYQQSLHSSSRANIDVGVSWHSPETIDDSPSLLRRRSRPPTAPFHGLGKRTLSLEVAAALLDNLPNLVYLGLGFRGLRADALLRSVDTLKFAIAPTTDDATLLPTTKNANWLTVRVVESGGFDAEKDPQTFDDFLSATPCVVPPWSSDMCPVDADSLAQFRPSQLYDDTAAFTGLIEYTLRSLSRRQLCGDALNTFVKLQSIIDTSKMQRINEFFSSRMDYPSSTLPPAQTGSLHSLRPFESSIPQISNTTLAQLLDLMTTSRAFAFGEWLLRSDDVDGPPIPPSAYGDQCLAPAIFRFAAATKNKALCESVVRSLAPPLSLNTLRALANVRIALHQWDFVVPILTFLRKQRTKSWSHSNVAALAAEIIRLDHTLPTQQQSDPTSMAGPQEETQRNLARAKEILLRMLSGEFNERHPSRSKLHGFQERSLYAFHSMFSSFPFPFSPTLREIARSATIQYSPKFPNTTHDALPYFPITSFNTILSALVETRGSAAGKRLWNRWCVDAKAPALRRLQKGGIQRFYLNHERNTQKGDPHFDSSYFQQVQNKATNPDPNTVRIIAQKAVEEYEAFQATRTQKSSSPFSSPSSSLTLKIKGMRMSPAYPPLESSVRNPAHEILEFCIQRFKRFGLRDKEINREVGGMVYRLRRWGKEKNKLKVKQKQELEELELKQST